jgi:hypothetical protein
MQVPMLNAIILCPGHAFAMDSVTLPIIAHELGHALDPCVGRVWRVNQKAPTATTKAAFPWAEFLANLKTQKHMSEDADFVEVQDKLEQNGNLRVVTPAYSKDNYPLDAIGRCLAGAFNIKYSASNQMISRHVRYRKFLRTGSDVDMDPNSFSTEDRAKFNQVKERLADAIGHGCQSNLMELIPDYLAALTTQELVDSGDLSFTSRADQYGLLYAGLASICSSRRGFSFHGDPQHRIRIFLSDPKIREMFGCELKEPLNCSLTGATGSGGSSATR